MFYGIAGLVVVGLIYVTLTAQKGGSDSVISPTSTSATGIWETKTDEQASVTVVVTPIDISPQSAAWKFEVVMDTHSVELDQDLIKITVLVDNQGKEYQPISWEGPVGGHHREGILFFNPITSNSKSLELRVSGIGGVVRNFSWELK